MQSSYVRTVQRPFARSAMVVPTATVIASSAALVPTNAPAVSEQSLERSRLLVIYLDPDMEFVWTLKHLDKTNWQRSSSVQIKPPRFTTRPLSGLGLRACGLVRKRCTKHVRLHLSRNRSGHEGVHDAVQPTWNDSGAIFEQTVEALRYALLDAHRFHRHGLRIEAKLFEHRCVRKPGCQYSDVDT